MKKAAGFVRIVSAMMSLIVLICVCGSCQSQGEEEAKSETARNIEREAYLRALKTEAQIRTEIIQQQSIAVQNEMGDAFYDYHIGEWYHPKYNHSSIRQYNPSYTFECFFPLASARLIKTSGLVCQMVQLSDGSIVEYDDHEVFVILNGLDSKETEYATRAIQELDDILKYITLRIVSDDSFETGNLYFTIGKKPLKEIRADTSSDNAIAYASSTIVVPTTSPDSTYKELKNNDFRKKGKLGDIYLSQDRITEYDLDVTSGFWKGVTSFFTDYLGQSYEGSLFVRDLKHEMLHIFGLADLYIEGEYHPNTGDSLMYGGYVKDFTERDRSNLDYIYNGRFMKTLNRVENEIRAKYEKLSISQQSSQMPRLGGYTNNPDDSDLEYAVLPILIKKDFTVKDQT